MNRTLDSITTDAILSKKDKKPKKDKKRRKAKKDKKVKKKKNAAGITININVGGGGGGKAKQPKQPRGAKGLVARTTSMRGQRGKGNLDQAARQAEANARAMQGIYGVSTRITETDKRVDDIGDRLTRLGQYFYTNQPAQIQQPPDQKFNVTMNVPDVGRLGTQVQDRFDRLEEGLGGAFVGIQNQIDGVVGANMVGDLMDEGYGTIEPAQVPPAPAQVPPAPAPVNLVVADDPDKKERTILGTETTGTPPLTSPPKSSSIFVEDGDITTTKKEEKEEKKKVVKKDVIMEQATDEEVKAATKKPGMKAGGTVLRFTVEQNKMITDIAELTKDYSAGEMKTFYATDPDFEKLDVSYGGGVKSIKQKIKAIKDKKNK